MATIKEYQNDPYAQYLRKLTLAESGGNPNAKNPMGTASGKYQFIESTWKNMTKKYGLNYTLDDRFDPKKSEQVTRLFTAENENYLKSKVGRELNDGDRYLAHFLGAGGASNLLSTMQKNPNAPISTVMSPNAINSNRSVTVNKDGSLKTVSDVYNWASKKMSVKPSQQIAEEVENDYLTPQVESGKLSYLADTTLFSNFEQDKDLEALQQEVEQQKQNEQNFITELIAKSQVQYFQPQEEQFTQQEQFQSGGEVIKDNNGYWNPNNWGKVVEIDSNNITMQGVREPLVGVSNTGDTKLMMPNNDYVFQGSKVTEYPLTENEKLFLQAYQDGGKKELNTSSQEYRDLYKNDLIVSVDNKGELVIPELEGVELTAKARPKRKITSLDVKIQNEREQGVTTKDSFNTVEKLKSPEVIVEQAKEYVKKIDEENKRTIEGQKGKRSIEVLYEKDEAPIQLQQLGNNREENIKTQQFLKSKGYNLNPDKKFKNDGIDGLVGNVTKKAIEDYNASIDNKNKAYTSYKDNKKGFLGNCTETQCSEYSQNENYRNLKPNMPQDEFRKLTGTHGDAWEIGKNINNAGGSSVKINEVKEGDFLGMFTGGSSPSMRDARAAGTDITHSGIVDKVNPDGSYYILHNVHTKNPITGGFYGKEYRDLVKNGKIVGTKGRGFSIREAYRPNYDKIEKFKEKPKLVKDAVLQPNEKFKEMSEKFEEKNYIGQGVEDITKTYLSSLNNPKTKEIIAKKHGLAENDYQSISKAALGIMAQESKLGTSDLALLKQPVAVQLKRKGFKKDEVSKGAGRVKFETNYGENKDLTELGITSKNFTKDENMPLVVVDILSTHYNYFIAKGETKEKALYKAIEKYNKGRTTEYSETTDVDYTNKVLNYASAFSVKKGDEEFLTTADNLMKDKKISKRAIKMK